MHSVRTIIWCWFLEEYADNSNHFETGHSPVVVDTGFVMYSWKCTALHPCAVISIQHFSAHSEQSNMFGSLDIIVP